MFLNECVQHLSIRKEYHANIRLFVKSTKKEMMRPSISRIIFSSSVAVALVVLLLVGCSGAAAAGAASPEIINVRCGFDANGNVQIFFNDSIAPPATMPTAHAFVNRTLNITGWNRVVISPDRTQLKTNASAAYFLGGYAEGVATWLDVLDNGYNNHNSNLSATVKEWMLGHIAAMDALSSPDHKYANLLVGEGTRRVWSHLRGLQQGVERMRLLHNPPQYQEPFAMLQALLIAAWAEMDDITTVANYDAALKSNSGNSKDLLLLRKPLKPTRASQHCSALMKFVPESQELFVAHDSWRGYAGLLRQIKTLHWDTSLTFSAFPGALSIDDFVISPRFSAIETTMVTYAESILVDYTTQETVLEFVRLMIASTWATTAAEWSEYFLMPSTGNFNVASSTYANSFMIVDFAAIVSSDEKITSSYLPPGTLTVVEQLGGPYSRTQDFTLQLLSAADHFQHSSYNIPLIPDVYETTLCKEACNNGSIFCAPMDRPEHYRNYSRYVIFDREGPSATTLSGMEKIMRYNEHQTDPASLIPTDICVNGATGINECSPKFNAQLSIACRADLVPKNAQFGSNPRMQQNVPFINYSLFGAIDTKITSLTMGAWLNKNKNASATSGGEANADLTRIGSLRAINGPTSIPYSSQPVFDWADHPNWSYRRGQPSKFNFTFVTMPVENFYATTGAPWPVYPPSAQPSSENGNHLALIFGIIAGGLVASAIVGLIIFHKWNPKKSNNNNSSNGGENGALQQSSTAYGAV